MYKTGFDNDKYIKLQSQKIQERISNFGGKLYMEFGGKLFDDYHASRVLPGFCPDSKIKMLLNMKDDAEVIVTVSASSIEQNKIRGDLGITYDMDTLRLIDAFTEIGMYVGGVVITQYSNQPAADSFIKRLENLGIKVYKHYDIPNYPYDIPLIVSDNGFGKNEYIETTRSLVVVTAPGPGSGKMATCLSQLYHDNLRGIKAGYAKFETFPIWNMPINHMVNFAYEAATADLKYTVATEACADRSAISDALRDVLTANTASTQRILDQLCQDKIDEKNDQIAMLRQQVQMQNLAASQQAQNAFIIDQLGTKAPIPAYVVANPYASGYYAGCGCSNI